MITASLLLAAAAASAPAVWPTHYGNPPEEMIPYRRATPNQRYFLTPQPFLGPGRETPPPPGLSELKIGLLAPAPGSYDDHRGRMMRRGVEMAIEEANAARHAAELPFRLIVREDTPLWGSAANIFVDFATVDEVLAVIGTVDGTATHVALRVALKAELFIVNPACSDPTLTETNIPWLLRTFPDDRQHGYRLASLIAKERGVRRIVDLRVNDRYGRVGIKIFNASVRRLGRPVEQEMRFLPGDRSFATPVARIKAVNPEAIVFWGEPRDVGRAAAALRAAGITAPFYGPDRLMEPAFLEEAGAAAEGTTITAPLDPEDDRPLWREFVARFQKRWGERPDVFAAHGFDSTRLLLDAIRKAGPNRFLVRDELAALKRYEGVSGTMLFDGTSNNIAPLKVFRVKNGAFVRVAEPASGGRLAAR